MYSNRMKNTSPPRRKHSAIKRVKPPRGTLPLLLALCAAVVLLILFAPKIGQSPAANVSGTEVEASAVSSGNTNLRVTEAMSSNRSAFPDETGAFPDWVELTNTGSDPINLKGYGLSDRADKITFVFPDITLAAANTSSFSLRTARRTRPEKRCTPNSSSPPRATSSSSLEATASPSRSWIFPRWITT